MASIQTTIELQDRVSQPLENIINSLRATVSAMQELNAATGAGMNTSSYDQARQSIENTANAVNHLNDAIVQANSAALNPVNAPDTTAQNAPVQVPVEPVVPTPLVPEPEPVTVPVIWQSDNIEIFMNTGVERFEQELHSANTMITQLIQNQHRVSQTASGMSFLPESAKSDISAVEQRLTRLQQRLQQLEDTPVSLRTDEVNNQIEQLRSHLLQAAHAQNELNAAMNAGQASAAYSQLSDSISSAERHIRDNINGQREFNQEIQNGVSKSHELTGAIGRMAAAYLSIQTVKNAMNASDEMTQTNARLNGMNEAFNKANGTAEKTSDLIDNVYKSAQNARAPLSDMAALIARFGNNARNAFDSAGEVVDFANLVQKSMVSSGVSAQEANGALLQLSQAMAMGTLRGQELNSVMSQTPALVQYIADYMDVDISKIKQLASEGKITADIVKGAIFNASEEINRKFEEMPMTWQQVWNVMGNAALKQFEPVLDKINQLANNADFQNLAATLVGALATVAECILNIFELAGSVASFISDNWSIIAPIVLGIVAAFVLYNSVLLIGAVIHGILSAAVAIHTGLTSAMTVATFLAMVQQQGLNAALAACPLVWIIGLLIAVIAIIFAVANAIAKMTGLATTGFGVIVGAINVVIAFFKNLGLTVANIAIGIASAMKAVGSNIVTALKAATSAGAACFYDLLSSAANAISGIAAELNKLPFVEFDYSGIVASANDFAAKSAAAAGYTGTYEDIGAAFTKGASTFKAFDKSWVGDAFQSGAKWGDAQMAKLDTMVDSFFGKDKGTDTSNIFTGGGYTPSGSGGGGGYNAGHVPDNIADTAANTGKAADSLDITKEDLKYLRDIAETEIINRFTTAEIKVDAPVTATINSEMDLDGIVNHLTNRVNEAMEKAAEGVYA